MQEATDSRLKRIVCSMDFYDRARMPRQQGNRPDIILHLDDLTLVNVKPLSREERQCIKETFKLLENRFKRVRGNHG